jgi:hypothetical protein
MLGAARGDLVDPLSTGIIVVRRGWARGGRQRIEQAAQQVVHGKPGRCIWARPHSYNDAIRLNPHLDGGAWG